MCVENMAYLSAPAVALRHVQRRCCGPRTLTGNDGIGSNAVVGFQGQWMPACLEVAEDSKQRGGIVFGASCITSSRSW